MRTRGGGGGCEGEGGGESEDGEGARARGDAARAPEQASARRRYFANAPVKHGRGPHLVPRADFIALPLAHTPPALSRPNPRPNPRSYLAHPLDPALITRGAGVSAHLVSRADLHLFEDREALRLHLHTGRLAWVQAGARRQSVTRGWEGPERCARSCGAGAALEARRAGTMIHGERSIHAVACRVGGC